MEAMAGWRGPVDRTWTHPTPSWKQRCSVAKQSLVGCIKQDGIDRYTWSRIGISFPNCQIWRGSSWDPVMRPGARKWKKSPRTVLA